MFKVIYTCTYLHIISILTLILHLYINKQIEIDSNKFNKWFFYKGSPLFTIEKNRNGSQTLIYKIKNKTCILYSFENNV